MLEFFALVGVVTVWRWTIRAVRLMFFDREGNSGRYKRWDDGG